MKIRSALGLALVLASSTFVLAQANLAGKWTGTMAAGRGGDQPVTLELTVAGTAITGKLTTGQGMPVDITNAKWADSKLTFSAAGGGGGGRGAGGGAGGGGGRGGGAPGGGAPGGGAPPAAAGGAPAGGAPGGGAGAGGGRQGGGGGRVQNFSAVLNAAGNEMTVTREAAAAPAGGAPGGGGAPAGAPPAGGAAPAGGGAGAGGGGGRQGGGGGGGPVTFTLKKG